MACEPCKRLTGGEMGPCEHEWGSAWAQKRIAQISHETLRDRFAMAALTGMLSADKGLSFQEAVHCWEYADFVLSARGKEK